MKHYVKPVAEVLVVLVEDVIRTSSQGPTDPVLELGDNLQSVRSEWGGN